MEDHIENLPALVDEARLQTKRLRSQVRKTDVALAKLADELQARGIKLELTGVLDVPEDNTHAQPVRRAQ